MKPMLITLVFVLLCAAAGCYAFDAAAFADRAFGGEGTYEEKGHIYEVVSETFPGATHLCREQDGEHSIRVGGKVYSYGIGTHADCHLRFTFAKPIKAFRTKVGIDSLMLGTPAELTYSVLADGKEVANGELKSDNGFDDIDISLDNVTTLELLADKGKEYTCDQFDWADALVVFADGEEAYLDRIAGASSVRYRYPFSFVYGGVSSDEFLHKWKFERQSTRMDVTVLQNTYTYTDPVGRLQVKAVVKIYEDTQALDWTVYFTCPGRLRSKVLSDINALAVEVKTPAAAAPEDALPVGLIMEQEKVEKQDLSDVLLCRMGGTVGCARFSFDEFRQIPQLLPKGETVTTEHTGLAPASGEYAPWWSLKWSDGGMVCGMGWTGNWKADYTADGDSVKVKAGFGNAFNAYLKPGETVRSARMLTVFFKSDDLQNGMNIFRRTMINHISPKQDGRAAMIPLAYTVSASETNAGTEEIDRKYIEEFKDLGFEVTWFDAYIQRDGFPACMGNYHKPVSDIIDPKRYPNGIDPLVSLANKYGKDIMVWFGPETVGKDTFIAKENPQWVMTPDGRPGGGSFALINDEAREYMTDVLSTAFRAWNVKVWKTDSGTDENCLLKYVGETDPNRKGIAENRWAQSLYRFWDDIRANKPDLLIDNCAGGCTRMDLELMSRSIIMWRTDSHCWMMFDDLKQARLNQLSLCRLNGYIPWSTCGQSGYSPYEIRSAFDMGLSYVNPVQGLNDENKAMLRKGVEECKRLRKYVWGDFYVLYCTDESTDDWCAWQYNRKEEKDGYFVAFRRETSPFSGMQLQLKGIDPDADYSVSVYETYDLKETVTMKGRELMTYTVNIPEKPGCLLVEYEAVK